MTIQDVFNEGIRAYNNGVAVVNAMNQVIIDNALIEDFEAKYPLAEFDLLVQYVLLETALADGRFSPNEGQFIDKITDTADIIKLMGADTPNWTWLAQNKGLDTIRNYISKVQDLARPYIDHFGEMFGLLDKIDTSRAYLDELIESFKDLTVSFCYIDGDPREEEASRCAEVLSKVLIQPWMRGASRA